MVAESDNLKQVLFFNLLEFFLAICFVSDEILDSTFTCGLLGEVLPHLRVFVTE